MGLAAGTDPVVTYTGDPSPDIAIADNRGIGHFHQINVTDDLAIADVDFRVSATHEFAGDLTFMLRSPGGIGTDLIALIGGVGSSGTNITNMVIDDDVPSIVANDMVQTTAAATPYTKSWLPVSNSPWISAFFPPLTSDPVGTLARYDGTSTLGTWTAHVADVGAADLGTFNIWSILVTPVHFTCTTQPVELLDFEVE